MTTRLLDPRRLVELQPAHLLWQLYRPASAPHRFTAQTPTQARKWQRQTRRALGQVLGLERLSATPLAPKKIEAVDRGDHTREKILLKTAPGVVMPCYLLLPKQGRKPFPVVLPDIQNVFLGENWPGSPFLGKTGFLPPSQVNYNPTAAYLHMWHSHNEKEIVNNDIFPGGLMTMVVIEPW